MYFDNPKIFNVSKITKIMPNPLDAPFMSAELNDIWEEIHIEINKNK